MRRLAAVGLAGTIAMAAAVLVGGPSVDSQRSGAQPTSEAAAGTVRLPLPPPGHVSAEGIGDVPVFVVHDEAGDVHVLDARSPHDPFPEVLAWCETSQTFEDLWHQALFSPAGWWIGGPAPSGMTPYAIVAIRTDDVLVGEPLEPRARDGRPTDLPQPGPLCDIRTSLYGVDHQADPTVVDDLVVHDPTGFPEELWFPTPERVLGRATRSPLDEPS